MTCTCRECRAEQKAERLLIEHLTAKQRRVWRALHYVPVTGSKGGRYWLYYYGTFAVDVVDNQSTAGSSYCLMSTIEMPDADDILARMLLLVTDEDTFLATANRGA